MTYLNFEPWNIVNINGIKINNKNDENWFRNVVLFQFHDK